MAGDDAVAAVNENGIGEAEAPDRAGDLGHLLVAVGSGVLAIGQQLVEPPVLELQPSPAISVSISGSYQS